MPVSCPCVDQAMFYQWYWTLFIHEYGKLHHQYIYIYIYIYIHVCICVCVCGCVLHQGKEEIHGKIGFIIYKLNWYSPTRIISLTLLVLRRKLFYYWPRSSSTISLFLFLLLLRLRASETRYLLYFHDTAINGNRILSRNIG